MKINLLSILIILLLLSRTSFAQVSDSVVKIKVVGEKHFVSGIVRSESLKSEVVERTSSILGANADFSQLKVSSQVNSFRYLWGDEFDKSLKKIKSWKSGIFVFTFNNYQTDFPPIPQSIADAKIELYSPDKFAQVKDFNDKNLVLLFIATWCGPCINQAEYLRDFYPRIASGNIEVIALDSDDESKADFQSFVKRYKFPFNYGQIDSASFLEFVKISKIQGIPQVFVISKGKLAGIFTGNGIKTKEKLAETLLKISGQNNQSK
jgi:peroxiredoxin